MYNRYALANSYLVIELKWPHVFCQAITFVESILERGWISAVPWQQSAIQIILL